jgi:hypothetical protein
MAEPLSMAPPPAESDANLGDVDDEMSVGSGDPDATWQMPSSTEAPSSMPSDDLGGFEDFASPAAPDFTEPSPPPLEMAPPPPRQDDPVAAASKPPAKVDPLTPMTPMTPIEMEDPFTPEPPELGATNEVPPVPRAPEPIPSVDTRATIDPVRAGGKPIEPLSVSSRPSSPEPPELTEIPVMSTEPETDFAPVDAASGGFSFLDTPEPAEDEPPMRADEPPMMEMPAQSSVKATPAPEPPMVDAAPIGQVPTQSREPAAVSASSSSVGVDDDLVERVAQRVVDKLSSKVIQEIAWEVVPDLAEGLIRREIDALKSKLPKSG